MPSREFSRAEFVPRVIHANPGWREYAGTSSAPVPISHQPIAPTIDGNGRPIPAWKQIVLQRRLDADYQKVLQAEKESQLDEGRSGMHVAAIQQAAVQRKNRLVRLENKRLEQVKECDRLFAPAHEHARECTICYSDDVSTRLDGCGHQIMCKTCVKMLVATVGSTCPLCRTGFSGYLCSPRFGFCDEFTTTMPWAVVCRSTDIRVSKT